MYRVLMLHAFDDWIKDLKNPIAKKAIFKRIQRIEQGNLGDFKSVGDGVIEFRIHVSSGIRLYAIQKDDVVIILLLGGDKSTQNDDITKAKQLAKMEIDYDNPAKNN